MGKLLKDRKLKLEVTAAAKDRIITEGYDPQYGARPMRRAIQRLIQDPLALKLLNGDFLRRRHHPGGRRGRTGQRTDRLPSWFRRRRCRADTAEVHA